MYNYMINTFKLILILRESIREVLWYLDYLQISEVGGLTGVH